MMCRSLIDECDCPEPERVRLAWAQFWKDTEKDGVRITIGSPEDIAAWARWKRTSWPFNIDGDCSPASREDMCWHVAPPAYAWPGGYTIIYFAAPDYRPQGEVDGEELCAICAGQARDQGRKILSDVYYEGPDVECAECCIKIESAYGDPNAKDDEDDDFAGHVG